MGSPGALLAPRGGWVEGTAAMADRRKRFTEQRRRNKRCSGRAANLREEGEARLPGAVELESSPDGAYL